MDLEDLGCFAIVGIGIVVLLILAACVLLGVIIAGVAFN